MSDTIRVIFFQDGEQWAAQCLEHDIGAQAPDLDTLRMRLQVVLDMECAQSIEVSGEPFAGIDPAPERFHDMWEHRSRSFSPGGLQLTGGDREVSVDLGLAA